MFGIKTKIRYFFFKYKWIAKHPDTIPMNCFSPKNVIVGKGSYGELNVVSFNDKSKLSIGNFVSIAQHVTFLLDADHQTNTVSTYPFRRKMLHEGDEAVSKGNIVVDDDVWIGYGAAILSGIHIGQGAVIASGAVVSRDVEPYSIVGGVPAKLIKKRFREDVIEFLKTLDYGQLSKEMIRDHEEDLYKDLESLSLVEVKNLYSWFPKKR